MSKGPRASVRSRLREEQTKQNATARIIAAILTEAEGSVVISREAFQNPEYGGIEILVREDEIEIRGQPLNSAQ